MKFLADENLQGRIFRGLRAALPDLDLTRVQDTAWLGLSDPELLEQAAQVGAVIITHDFRTLAGYAFDRVRQGKPMPGVIEVSSRATPGRVIEELIVVTAAGTPTDFEDQILYIPLR